MSSVIVSPNRFVVIMTAINGVSRGVKCQFGSDLAGLVGSDRRPEGIGRFERNPQGAKGQNRAIGG